MDKRFWISGIAAFLIVFTGGWLVHGMLLTADYMKTPQLFRSAVEPRGPYVPFMVAAYVLMGFAFTWIYRQGIAANRPWLVQGIRFGLAAALMGQIPLYLIYYVVQPMELSTVIKQVIGDGITMIVCGIVVAFINRSARESTT
jgi:hypothetical protein